MIRQIRFAKCQLIKDNMVTSWVLFIVVSAGSRSITIIPNLKDIKECQRIKLVIEDRANINFTSFCMETINK